jgi:DnaK suppressor protein
MTSQDIESTLTELRNELTARLTGIHADLASGRSRDSAEQAQETENDEVLHALAYDAQREIKEIDKALSRLQDGHYGLCIFCEEQIDPRRLEAYPMATHCIECS